MKSSKRLFFAALLVATLPAHASGDPSAIVAGGVPVVVLGAATIHVFVAAPGWRRKARALLPVVLAAAAVVALGFVPDYARRASWLLPASIALALAGAAMAWRSVARPE